MPYRNIAKPSEYKDFSNDNTTCSNNYGLSKQSSAVISDPLSVNPAHKSPEEQTTDEWLNNWEKSTYK